MSPLAGMRVLIPRPTGRSSRLVGLLRSAAAEPLAVQMISIEPAEPGPLAAALQRLSAGEYRWVGFTSVNGVRAVLDAATTRPVVPPGTGVAAVGPATADALRDAGIAVDLAPAQGGSSKALARMWPAADPGDRVLLPRSAIAPPTLVDALTERGFAVDPVSAYRTRTVPVPAAMAADLASGRIDAVLLTSDSTVAALSGVPVAATTAVGVIGSTTARAAAAAGLTVAFVSPAPTEAAMVAALAVWAGRRRDGGS